MKINVSLKSILFPDLQNTCKIKFILTKLQNYGRFDILISYYQKFDYVLKL